MYNGSKDTRKRESGCTCEDPGKHIKKPERIKNRAGTGQGEEPGKNKLRKCLFHTKHPVSGRAPGFSGNKERKLFKSESEQIQGHGIKSGKSGISGRKQGHPDRR